MKQSVKQQARALLRELEFTEEDLEANRRGEMSRTQLGSHYGMRLKLLEDAASMPPSWHFLLRLLVICAVVVAVLLVTGILQAIASFLGVLALPVFGLVIGAAVWFAITGHRGYQRYLDGLRALGDRDAPLPPIKMTMGTATTMAMRNSRSAYPMSHYLIVNDEEEMRIPEEAMYAFEFGVVYRVYSIYYGDAHLFLSAEVVENVEE